MRYSGRCESCGCGIYKWAPGARHNGKGRRFCVPCGEARNLESQRRCHEAAARKSTTTQKVTAIAPVKRYQRDDAFNGSKLLHMPVEKFSDVVEAILKGEATFTP